MSNSIAVGPHEVRYEPDTGFVFVRHEGVLEAADAPALLDACAKFARPGEPVFMLADDRRATGITPEARRILSSSGNVGDRLYLAIFGGNFAFRAIANLVFKAMTISSKKMIAVMVSDEAEAREWLVKQQRSQDR